MRNLPANDPRLEKAFRNLEEAVSLQRKGLHDDADKMFSRVIKKNPDYFDAFHLYGLFKYQQRQFNEALTLVAKATKINPRSANAFNSLGVIFAHLGRHQDAVASFDSALKIDPNHVQALSNRCNSLNELGRYNDAIESSNRALALNPNFIDAYIPRGAALLRCHRLAEALASFESALRLNPNVAMAWVGRGKVLFDLKRYTEALAAYEQALKLRNDLSEAWNGRGHVLFELRRYDDALAAYNNALSFNPDVDFTEGVRLTCRMYLCDWTDYANAREHVISAINGNKESINPFGLLALSASSEEQLKCAKLWVAKKCPRSDNPIWQGEVYKHDRIRIAYVSADYRPHPVSYLIAGFLEGQSRDHFELTGISLQPEDPSEIGQRIKHAFDRFIDVTEMPDQKVAKLFRELEIDIAVDLNGHTQTSRPMIFAHRGAPVQVSYLGFPGTTGADYIDYVIADRTVIPDKNAKYFSEKIAWLPDTFWVSDQTLPIGTPPGRTEAALPEGKFVFCCFNQTYKIVPDRFDCWMRVLKQVDGSILWLSHASPVVRSNLKNEAARRGIDPERLIFAPIVPRHSDHLARLTCADLFLDTLPYNAHTTASEALWAGLPVLTQIGDSFAGRVAASLLNAIGLPELIAQTQDDYENTAIELATNPDRLSEIKSVLAGNRLTMPLFNTQLSARHIESAYEAMYERYQKGLTPDHIHLPH